MEEFKSEDAIAEDLADAVGHGILVSNLSVLVAGELGESQRFLQNIAMAGMLHDIGKLKLSGQLYGRKKDTLQIEELKYVRMHSALSYEILKEKDFGQPVLDAVLHHHENYDGSGYPDNLKGEDIPWGARIIRTCDVYAALVSDRPYRTAFDMETAMELMIDEVKNFDMRVFLAFQRGVHSEAFKKISEYLLSSNQMKKQGRQMFEAKIKWC